MPQIHFIDHTGQKRSVQADIGQTVMEAAIKAGIPGVVAECGGACACATCHVYVAEDWKAITGEPSHMEEDMLDFAYEVRPVSRLSCQIRVTAAMDGLTVTTPERQG
jgi:2Fe-2S ferredoxin